MGNRRLRPVGRVDGDSELADAERLLDWRYSEVAAVELHLTVVRVTVDGAGDARLCLERLESRIERWGHSEEGADVVPDAGRDPAPPDIFHVDDSVLGWVDGNGSPAELESTRQRCGSDLLALEIQDSALTDDLLAIDEAPDGRVTDRQVRQPVEDGRCDDLAKDPREPAIPVPEAVVVIADVVAVHLCLPGRL